MLGWNFKMPLGTPVFPQYDEKSDREMKWKEASCNPLQSKHFILQILWNHEYAIMLPESLPEPWKELICASEGLWSESLISFMVAHVYTLVTLALFENIGSAPTSGLMAINLRASASLTAVVPQLSLLSPTPTSPFPYTSTLASLFSTLFSHFPCQNLKLIANSLTERWKLLIL